MGTSQVRTGSNDILSIIGLGKLGAPMAASLASSGFQVIGVDTSRRVVESLNAGQAPVEEPGLAETIQVNRSRLTAVSDLQEAVLQSGVTFIVVPTPSDAQGGFALQHVVAACEQIGAAIRRKSSRHLVVVASTVLPGAMEQTIQPALERASGKRCGVEIGLCYSPEFIALGSVLRDLQHPDFVLIGESDPASGDRLEQIYRRVCRNAPRIARTNFVNAELAKLAVNTFVTTKITFANMLAAICERLPSADVGVVSSILGSDSRIGAKYLAGGASYGGPCFPRDNAALAHLARSLGVPATLAEATDAANRHYLAALAQFVESKLPPGGVVGVLGLAYKPQTNVIDQSPGVLLAAALAAHGVSVVGYDPAAMDNARMMFNGSVALAPTLADCLQQTDVIVLVTPWPEFHALNPDLLRRPGRPRIVIDCWRLLDRERLRAVAEYIPLGVGASASGAVQLSGQLVAS